MFTTIMTLTLFESFPFVGGDFKNGSYPRNLACAQLIFFIKSSVPRFFSLPPLPFQSATASKKINNYINKYIHK